MIDVPSRTFAVPWPTSTAWVAKNWLPSARSEMMRACMSATSVTPKWARKFVAHVGSASRKR